MSAFRLDEMTPQASTLPAAVRTRYDGLAATYDRRWKGYNERSLAMLCPFLARAPLGGVLDLGCGTANLLPRLVRWDARFTRYVGVDPSPAMLYLAQAKLADGLPAELIAGCAEEIPLGTASVDTVVSASAFHYWSEPERGLAEVRRVLRPGGRFLLLDWSRDALTMRALDVLLRITREPYRRMYSRRECRVLLRDAGFSVAREDAGTIGLVWRLMVFDATRAT